MYAILFIVLILFIIFLLICRAAVRTVIHGLLTGIDVLFPGTYFVVARIAGAVWGIFIFLLALGFLIFIAALFCGW